MRELKKLFFDKPYPPILFTAEKTKTFRVTGGNRFDIGDNVSLCYVDGVEFDRAVISDKYRKKFEDLTENDWIGHERFDSEEQMFNTYSRWEGFKVGPKTKLDILVYKDFRLTGETRL